MTSVNRNIASVLLASCIIYNPFKPNELQSNIIINIQLFHRFALTPFRNTVCNEQQDMIFGGTKHATPDSKVYLLVEKRLNTLKLLFPIMV